jgi:hypothetical protein
MLKRAGGRAINPGKLLENHLQRSAAGKPVKTSS